MLALPEAVDDTLRYVEENDHDANEEDKSPDQTFPSLSTSPTITKAQNILKKDDEDDDDDDDFGDTASGFRPRGPPGAPVKAKPNPPKNTKS